MARSLFILLAGLALISISAALEVPYLSGRVNDQADLLSENSRASITSTLQQLEQTKGAQVAVLTIANLQGESLEDFTISVAEAWKLGRKDIDDGVLLLVAKDDRKIRIEVGYGLEGVLTDLDSRRIIDKLMVPAFRSGNFEQGIELAVNAISDRIKGEEATIPVSAAVSGASSSSSGDFNEGSIAFLILFAFFISPFARIAVALKGIQGWFMYLFLAPFFFLFPMVLGESIALFVLLVWLAIGAILRLILPKKWRIDPGTGGGGGSSSSSGGGYSGGGGFSGGSGSFGGGGASGGW